MNRCPSPVQRYKKNMARVVFNARSSVFTKEGLKNIRATFRTVDPQWHDVIADEYPLYVSQFVDHLDMDKDRWFDHDEIKEFLWQVYDYRQS